MAMQKGFDSRSFGGCFPFRRSAVPPFRRQARVASGILIPGGRLVALWVSLLPRIKLAP
jgi:hypothetical protein